MPENWYEDEEAVLRLSAIAASLKGEALSEEEEALAPLILAELKSWCHIDAVPEGALGGRRKSCCGGSRGSRGAAAMSAG